MFWLDDASGHTFWNYDVMGRVTLEQRSVNVPNGPPVSFAVRYTYNFDGTVSSVTYPSGRQVSYLYDSVGRTTQVSKNDFFGSGQELDYVSAATYMPDGQLAEVTLGTAPNCTGFTGATGEFSYNQRLQPAHLVYTTGSAAAAISEIGSSAARLSGKRQPRRVSAPDLLVPAVQPDGDSEQWQREPDPELSAGRAGPEFSLRRREPALGGVAGLGRDFQRAIRD